MGKEFGENCTQKILNMVTKFRHSRHSEIIAAAALLVLSVALLANPQMLLSQAPQPSTEAMEKAYYASGLASFNKKDYDRTIIDLSEVIRLNPDNADAYNLRGKAHIASGEYERAVADFNQAIKLNPEYAEAFANRSLAYEKQGNKAMATGDAVRGLDLGLASEVAKEFARWDEVHRRQLEEEEAERAYWIKGFTEWMVPVHGGTFTMGCTSEQGGECNSNESPAHQVTVNDFLIGKYKVTNAQWSLVTGGSYPSGGGAGVPATGVSWNDVQMFIKQLNARTKRNYRLPTEAEWEYAARGGNKSQGYKYSGGNNPDELNDKANELGIYDMSSSVLEWVHDRYEDYSSSPQTNPIGTSSDRHVVRGGNVHLGGGRVSSRIVPGERGSAIGFRLALSRESDYDKYQGQQK